MKKEIIITACIAAALIIAFILFNSFYDNGSLKVKNGVVQASENSLILNTGSAKHPVFYKIGQLTEIEGYTLESNERSSNGNVKEYVYYPEGESDIDLISVNTYAYDATTYSSAAEQLELSIGNCTAEQEKLRQEMLATGILQGYEKWLSQQ